MLHTVTKVNGKLLWANLHLLFWLSLIPFSTGWMGENHFAALPTAVYGFVLLMSAAAYFILERIILISQGRNSILAQAVGKDVKGKLSPILYLLAIGATWINPAISGAIYVFVALMWLIPDLRIEKAKKIENVASF